MVSVLAVLHVVVCIFLILLIMIQDPKGGSSGLFSGGSNSIIGASGSADFLTKITRYTAITFGVLCIALTIATKPSTTGVFSSQPGMATEQKTEAPAAPTEGAVAPTPAGQPPAPGAPAPELPVKPN